MTGEDRDDAGPEVGAPFSSAWTMPRSGVDFTGFRIPTRDDAPWGTTATLATLTTSLDVGPTAGARTSRIDVEVVFDPVSGMLVSASSGVAHASPSVWLGLRALVNLRVERRQWGSAGMPSIVVVGRCLSDDAERMAALVAGTLETELEASIAETRRALRALRATRAATPATP